MLEPAELLEAARLLTTPGATPPSEGRLRRAVSTSYYALFHTLLRAAAEHFIGAGRSTQPGFAILYRGFNHGRIKTVCIAVDVAQLSPSLARQLGRQVVHRDLRDCASSFVTLQGARHRADYDPHATFTHHDVTDLIEEAAVAMTVFHRAPAEERADFLALMLANPRD